ncbi:MAG: hypothetical protein LBT26_02105 [Clostridiales Family XIII bacterium]|jgi:hypothetical protein|nr:hypothetical protein [Clostridiales Family XIII bacterium]
MSYDLMVFEPSAAPRTKPEFEAWYAEQTKWGEGHGYDDPAVSSPALQAWFAEMRINFPPLNGPFALSDDEFDKLGEEGEARATDYTIGKTVIYAGFAWSLAESGDLDKTVRQLARRCNVGFYHPGSGEALFPDDGKKIRMRTQNDKDRNHPTWEDVWLGINRLSKAAGEFIVLDEAKPSGKIAYLQAMYLPGKRGAEGRYQIEAQLAGADDSDGMPQYSHSAASVNEVTAIFRDWFVWRQVPDFSSWNDAKTALRTQEPDRKNERVNKIMLAGILIVGGVIVVGVIAYFVWLFVS